MHHVAKQHQTTTSNNNDHINLAMFNMNAGSIISIANNKMLHQTFSFHQKPTTLTTKWTRAKKKNHMNTKTNGGLSLGCYTKKKYQTDTPTGVQSNITTKHFGKI